MEIQNKLKNALPELWTVLIKYDLIGTVDDEELLEYLQMTKQQRKEQELLKQHLENFYHIWQNDKGIYLSYLPAPDKAKGRRPVTATTREKLERKIIDFYLNRNSEQEEQKRKNSLCTLRAVYPLWLKLKGLETTASTYIRRIDTDWKKYYLEDAIIDTDIRTLSKLSLKEWALTKIRTLELTKRQYYNMSMIIRQCLDYAAEQGLIPSNPYNDFTIEGKLFRKVKKPKDDTQVFLKSERPLIEAEA